MQIRLYPHLSVPAVNSRRPVSRTQEGRALLPGALSWLQPLPWDSALRGASVAAVSGQRLPIHLSVAALTAGVQQACLDNPLVMLPLQHPLSDALRRAGYVTAGRRRTYTLELDRRVLHRPHRADLQVSDWTTEPDAPLDQLMAQAATHLRLADGPWLARQAQHYLRRAVAGEAAFATHVVTTAQGQIAGVVTVAKRGTQAEIGVLAVAGPWRRQGVARLLLQAAAQSAQKAGLTRLMAHTEADNLPLCNVYQKAGFSLGSEQLLFPLGQLRYQRAA